MYETQAPTRSDLENTGPALHSGTMIPDEVRGRKPTPAAGRQATARRKEARALPLINSSGGHTPRATEENWPRDERARTATGRGLSKRPAQATATGVATSQETRLLGSRVHADVGAADHLWSMDTGISPATGLGSPVNTLYMKDPRLLQASN